MKELLQDVENQNEDHTNITQSRRISKAFTYAQAYFSIKDPNDVGDVHEMGEIVKGLENIKFTIEDSQISFELGYDPLPNRCGSLHPSKNQIFTCCMYGLHRIDLDTNEHKFIRAIEARYPTQFMHIGRASQKIFLYSQYKTSLIELDPANDYEIKEYDPFEGKIYSFREVDEQRCFISLKQYIDSEEDQSLNIYGGCRFTTIFRLKKSWDNQIKEIIDNLCISARKL